MRFLPTVVLTVVALSSSISAQSWPQFRGPGASGVALDATAPDSWSRTENVAWSVEVPGRGWSSPVVWEDRVFLTSAISLGDFKEPSPGIYGNDYIRELIAQGLTPEQAGEMVMRRDNEGADEVGEGLRWMLYAFDVATGERILEREVHAGLPFGGRHRKNTYASETPVTDGERLYVYFGNVGVFAFTLEGESLWSTALEPHSIYLDFGTASSPLLAGDLLVVQNDNEESSYLLALDRRTGEEVWRVERATDHPIVHSSFSTPFLWANSVRTEVVTSQPGHLISYSLEGEELWRLAGTSAVAVPTPVAEGDMLYLGNGSPSEPVRPIHAIRAGASGDITPGDGETANRWVAWSTDVGGSYIPSPILYDGRLYVLYDKGFLAAYDAATGEELYRARFGRGGHTFSASPWIVDGKLYCLSEGGQTFVVEPGDEFELVGSNDLEEMALATPAVAAGGHFIRTATRLYRIAAPGAG